MLLSVLLLCNIGNAANTSQAFSLESPLSGTVYGPFVLQDNYVAEISAKKYLVQISPNGYLQLKDMETDTVSEPYEFMNGRMVRINDSLFTIVDINEIPYVKPIPAPISETKPKPAIKPMVAVTAAGTTAIAATKADKRIRQKSAYRPTSAMWTTETKQTVKTTPKQVKKYTPKPVSKPVKKQKPKASFKRLSEPKPDATSYFTTSRYPASITKPKSRYSYQSRSKTVPYNPKSSSPSKLRPYKGLSFADRLGIAVDISALEKVNYDYKVSGIGSTEAEISRNSIAVKFKVMPFTLELGKVFSAEWSGEVSGTNSPFQNLNLSNGSGWWWDLKYKHLLWEKDGWLFAATADGSYRKEDYDLSYGIWQDKQIVIPPAGTNSEATIAVIKDLASTTQPAVFTETMFKLGLALAYKADYWGCWATTDFIAYNSADIESTINTAEGSYTIDVERTDPFIFTLGASIKRHGVNWFSTISLAGESAIRFGVNYKF